METKKERKKNPVGKLSLLRLYIFFANQIIKKYKTNNLIYILRVLTFLKIILMLN